MTQEILAGAAGVSARTVLRAERGDEISAENLRAICSVLTLDAGAMMGREVDANIPNSPAVGTEAPQGGRVTPGWARLAWRRGMAPVAIMLALLGVANMWTGYVASLRDWNLSGREMSAIGGGQVAARTNAALALVSKAETHVAPGMGASRDYWVVNCTPSSPALWIFGVNGTCDTSATRLDVRRSAPEGMAFVVGPVNDSFMESFALQVVDPPGTSLRVTFSKDAGTPRQGAFWFDPRGSDPRLLPRVSPERAYMHVEIAQAGEAR